MKGSLATSAVLHAVVLTMALVSLGAPESFDVADVEAMPVDIVPIDLPKTAAKALNADTQPITISVRADGEIYLQETPIPAEEVAAKLQAVATTGYTERIFVRGDGTAPYGIIADVMSRIQNAGFTNIGLVTEQKQDE